jgi:hypothetical protein
MGRIGARLTPAAELLERNVLDARRRKRDRKRLCSEVRVLARTGIASDVGDGLDTVFFKQIYKFVQRTR